MNPRRNAGIFIAKHPSTLEIIQYNAHTALS